jgi:hypothetical protein
VENTKARHSIFNEDTYNFDESSFIIGMISTRAVVTGSERQGRPKSVQQGNREWTTVIQGINATRCAILSRVSEYGTDAASRPHTRIGVGSREGLWVRYISSLFEP